MPAKNNKKTYSISDVASTLQVSQHVIRRWEKEIELEVARNERGHRTYSTQNIETLVKHQQRKISPTNVEEDTLKIRAQKEENNKSAKKFTEAYKSLTKVGKHFKVASAITLVVLFLLTAGIANAFTSETFGFSKILSSIQLGTRNPLTFDISEDIDADVLGQRDQPADFLYSINVPTNIGGDFTVEGDSFFQGDINLQGTGTLVGLTAIDATTQTTIQNSLTLGGDLEGTLGEAIISAGVLDGTEFADEVVLDGDLDVSGEFQADGDAGSDGQVLTSTGSGIEWLDIDADEADTLDGIDSLQFLRSDVSDTYTVGTLSFADSTFLDLSAIVHDDTTPQGLLLPQADFLEKPSTGAGYLAYEADEQRILVYNGSNWANISGASSSMQEAYEQGSAITMSAAEGDLRVSNDALTEVFFADEDTGRVGIGTITPSYKLSVVGDIQISNGSELYSFGSATLGNRTYTEDNYVIDGQTFTASIDNLDQQLADVVGGTTGLWRDSGSYIYANNYNDFAITDGGDVGIGTNTPSFKLDVVGTLGVSGAVDFDGLTSSTSENTIVVQDSNGVLMAREFSDFVEDDLIAVGEGAEYFLPRWTASRTLTDSSIYDNGTFVGIGTSSPVYNLDVTGTFGATGQVVLTGLGTGTDNSVIVLNSSDQLVTDEIDSRVWGTTLLDDTDIGVTLQGYDANTSLLGSSIEGSEITNDTIEEIDLEVTNSGTDDYLLSYDNATGGFTWVDPTTAGTFDGSGTANYITKFTDADTLANSVIYETGGNVGIGTTAPVSSLYVTGGNIGTDLSYGFKFYAAGDDRGGLTYNNVTAPYPGIQLGSTNVSRGIYLSYGTSKDFGIFSDSGGFNSTPVIYANSSDNVGIGTTAPAAKLHVIGDINVSNTSKLVGTANASGGITFNATGTTIGGGSYVGLNLEQAGDYIDFTKNSSSLVRIEGTGNIGIGTTAPSYKLDVNGDINIASGSDLYSEGTATLGTRLYTEDNYVVDSTTFTAAIDALDQQLFDVVSGASGIWTDQGTYIEPSTSAGNFVISDAGLVGIGTTSPSASLHVASGGLTVGIGTEYSGSINLANSGTYRIGNTSMLVKSGTSLSIYDGRLLVDSSSNTTIPGILTVSGSSDSSFVGNLGIGTTSPTDTLHVVGNILATTGIHIGTDADGTLIDDASNGASSTTLYIGNESILASGDLGVTVQGYNADTSFLAQTIEGSEITDSTIEEIDFEATNSATDNYMLTYDNATGGFTWVDPTGSGVGSIDGSGTANYVTKWSDSNTLADSILYDTGTALGIGTTAPSATLSVVGDFTVDNINLNGNTIAATTAAGLFLQDDGGNGIFVEDGGFVGIGNTNPVYPLHVTGTTPFRLERDGSYNFNYNIIGSGASAGLQIASGGANSGYSFVTRDSGNIAVEALLINGEGNVGIGTTAPSEKLEISGNLLVNTSAGSLTVDNAGSSSVTVASSGSLLLDSAASNTITFNNGGTQVGIFGTTGYFGIGTDTTPDGWLDVNDLLIVEAGGNVGIGSTDPTSLLSVGGGNQFQVDSSGDITKINNVTYSFPASQAAASNYVLSNDGSGTLAWTSVSGVGGLDGTGTANYLPLWSDSDTLTSSSLYETGGNIGIGTTDPSNAAIDIVTSETYGIGISNAKRIGLRSGTAFTGNVLDLYASTSSGAIVTGTALTLESQGPYNLIFKNNSSEAMRINSSGNIGIGTTSPTSLLSVGAASEFQVDSSGDIVKLNNVTYAWPSSQAAADNYVLTNDSSGNLAWEALGAGGLGGMDGSGTAGYTALWSDADTLTSSSIYETGGQIGIGTTAPGTLNPTPDFLVDASSRILELRSANSSRDAGIFLRDSDNAGMDLWVDGSTNRAYIDALTNSDTLGITFRTKTITGTATEAMTIVGSGAVGIGTTAPAANLESLDTTEQLRLSFDASNYGSFTVDATGDLTIAPSGSDLNITGNQDISGHLAIGTNGAYNANYIVDIDETSTLDANVNGINIELDRNFTQTAARSDSGNYVSLTINDVVENGFNYSAYGTNSNVTITEGSTANGIYGASNYALDTHTTGTVDNLTGTYSRAINDAEGLTTTLYGVRSFARNDGYSGTVYGGHFTSRNDSTVADAANYYGVFSIIDNNADTATNARAFYGIIDNAASKNIATSAGLYLDLLNSGTIGTNYGIYINDVIEGTQTNAYGIWANEGDWVLDEDGNGVIGGTGPGGDFALGEAQDLELYHDGTNSYIMNNTGDLYIGDAGTDDVILSNNGGNVGIDTATPNAKLTIKNNVTTGFLDNYSEYQVMIYDGTAAPQSYGMGVKGNTMVFNSGAGAYSFDRGGTSTSLYIETNGNVGIGTTSPSYKLDVNGDINIASGSDLYSEGTATLGDRLYTEDNYVADSTTFTAAIDALDQQVYDLSSGAAGLWNDNTTYISPTTSTSFVINDDGKVGIGTTNPEVKLDVAGGGEIRLVGNSGFGWVSARIYDGGSQDQGWFKLLAGNSTRVNINADSTQVTYFDAGNVGIGTTSPVSKLQVVGDEVRIGDSGTPIHSSSDGDLYVEDAIESGGIITAKWASGLGYSTGVGIINNSTNYFAMHLNGAYSRLSSYYGSGLIVSTVDSNPIILHTNNTERARLDSSGNFGIGTTAPSELLEVAGNLELSGNSRYIRVDGGSLNLDPSSGNVNLYDNTNNFSLSIYNGATRGVQIDSNGTSWLNGGNVGIGTTAPTDTLHVVGNVLATTGVHIGTDADGTLIDDSTTGSSSTTLYIGNESILASGDIGVSVQGYDANTSLLAQTIEGSEITDDTIEEIDLEVTNAPTDDYVLSYDSATGGFTWIASGGGTLDGTGTANYLPLWSDSNTLTSSSLYETGGQIGIGTTAPTTNLYVYENATSYAMTIEQDSTSGNGLYIDNDAGGYTAYPFRIDSSNNAQTPFIVSGVGQVGINFTDFGATQASLSVKNIGTFDIFNALDSTTNKSVFIIKDGGDVGIGTTAPAFTLDVAGTFGVSGAVDLDGLTSDSSEDSIIVQLADGTLSYREFQDFTVDDGIIDGVGTANYIPIWNDANTIGLSSIYETGGNVGIGTTTPNAKLSIGNNLASGFLNNYSEYQTIIYNGGSAGTSYGMGVKENTMVFNSGTGGYSFDDSGSSTSLYIDTSGNVGIGTTAPSYKLEVSGGSTLLTTTGNGIDFVDVNTRVYETSDNLYLTADNNIYLQPDSGLYIGSDGGASQIRYVDTGTGRFGIGEFIVGTSPRAALHVDGATAFDTSITLNGQDEIAILDSVSTSGIGNFGASIGFNRLGSNAAVRSAAIAIVQTGADSDEAGLAFFTHPGTGIEDMEEALRIDDEGNVGIGTTSPEGQTHIFQASAGTVTAHDSADALVLENSGTTGISILTPDSATSQILFGSPSNALAGIIQWKYDDNVLRMRNNNTSGTLALGVVNDTNALYIDSDGNVGIGTTSPEATLHATVSGTGDIFKFSRSDSSGYLTYDMTANYSNFDSYGDYRFSAQGVEKMVLEQASGDLGIGTTNPTYQLDVVSSDTTGGLQLTADSVTTGTGALFSFDGLSTGTGMNLSSTSTALTTGSLFNMDWTPGSATTASGDLFLVNVGANATITGNILAIQDNGSDLFTINQATITSALPHSFTAAGDVSMAYDLIMTNQTTSKIESYGPFTLEVGESFESSDLTLKTYNNGNVYVNLGSGSTAVSAQLLVDGDITDFIAGFTNDGNADSREGLFIQGCLDANPTSACNLVEYRDGDGTIIGAVEGNGAGGVTAASGGSDYAELFTKDATTPIEAGDLIALNNEGKVEKAKADGSTMLIGAYSNNPNTLGNWFDGWETSKEVAPVGLLGQLNIKVSNEKGEIKAGDAITVSKSSPGVGVKAKSAGRIIGFAMEDAEIMENSVEGDLTRVKTYISPTWYVPSLALASGDLNTPEVAGESTSSEDSLAINAFADTTDMYEAMLAIFGEFQDFTEALGIINQVDADGNEVLAVSSDLNVTGTTTLADVKITGNLTAGLIEIDSVNNEVNVLGASCYNSSTDTHNEKLCEAQKLNIQAGLAGNVNFFKGQIVLAPNGTVTAVKVVTEELATEVLTITGTDSKGIATIKSGEKEIVIESSLIEDSALIFVTPNTDTEGAQLFVAEKVSGQEFTIGMTKALDKDIEFNWLIINSE